MATTYEPIATTTLTSSSTNVTFSNIPQTYTDLVVVINSYCISATALDVAWRANSDSGNNYSGTRLLSDSSPYTDRSSNTNVGNVVAVWNDWSTVTAHFMNYSNTTTYKTALFRSAAKGFAVYAGVTFWRSTSAISSLSFIQPGGQSGQYASGSTFTLYGIKAA
jgi:hypothetical protein